jgi:phage-related protein
LQVYNQDMRKVILYETAGGKCPVAEFLDSLPSKQAQKAAWVLRLIEELDIVPASYLKKLIDTDEIWEVRVSSGNDIFRLLCFFDGQQLIVIDHAFQKKTQKTPKQDIKIAEERRKDYFRRKLQ